MAEVDLNDTGIDLESVLKEDKPKNEIPKEEKPQKESLMSDAPKGNNPIKTMKWYANLVDKAKSPIQIKREQIAAESPEARRLRLLILNRYRMSPCFGPYLEELALN